jgi:hypothetical protein
MIFFGSISHERLLIYLLTLYKIVIHIYLFILVCRGGSNIAKIMNSHVRADVVFFERRE